MGSDQRRVVGLHRAVVRPPVSQDVGIAAMRVGGLTGLRSSLSILFQCEVIERHES